MNASRYRLEGVRYEDGEVSLQNRPNLAPRDNEVVINGNTELNQTNANGFDGKGILSDEVEVRVGDGTLNYQPLGNSPERSG